MSLQEPVVGLQQAEWSDPCEHRRLAELGVRALCLLKWPHNFAHIVFTVIMSPIFCVADVGDTDSTRAHSQYATDKFPVNCVVFCISAFDIV